jgi:exopolysaccharide production protein ExoY
MDRIPFWKRFIDIGAAGVALIACLPLMLALAVAIKAASPGPVFHKQRRVGRHGKVFTLWKFRTMRVDADDALHKDHLARLIESDAPMVKLDMADDPRIFPLGRILRRCYLDELPQLINVLAGQMSLVGPRPCTPYEVLQYKSPHMKRFSALPGMTGLWQVSGKNKTTFTEMIQLDIEYARNVSPGLDLKILLKTVPTILTEIRRSNYADSSHRPVD